MIRGLGGDLVDAIKNGTTAPSPSLNTSRKARQILDELGSRARVLDLGSGTKRLADGVINLDIGAFSSVDVIADGHALPFSDSVFDGVMSHAVLEHVANPGGVVAEIHRVPKMSGHVYAEVPFLQGYHASPEDYRRFTRVALERLFVEFDRVCIGVCVGPSSALAWMLREYLLLPVKPGTLLDGVMRRLVGWMTVPLKHLDWIVARMERAHTIAAGLYFHGRKRS